MHFFLHISTQKRIDMHFIRGDLFIFLREKGSVSRRGTTRSSTRNHKSLYGKNIFRLDGGASYANRRRKSDRFEME